MQTSICYDDSHNMTHAGKSSWAVCTSIYIGGKTAASCLHYFSLYLKFESLDEFGFIKDYLFNDRFTISRATIQILFWKHFVYILIQNSVTSIEGIIILDRNVFLINKENKFSIYVWEPTKFPKKFSPITKIENKIDMVLSSCS